MAKAKNKCPKCGGAVALSTDVACTIRVEPTGDMSLVTKPQVLIREALNVASRGYPYHIESVCEKCGEKLKTDVTQSGEFVFSCGTPYD